MNRINKTFAVYTLGCKVNQYETEAISELMTADGFEEKPFDGEPADIYIINTCSVTAAADSKNRNIIRQACRKNENAVIAVTGCFGQLEGKKLLEFENVSIVTGNGNRKDLPELIKQFFIDGKKHISVVPPDFHNMHYENLSVNSISGHTRAFVKIQDGCTQFCTYCIIPFARGAQRSRTVEDLKTEIEKLACAGYKEVVLTGINLTSYGKDFTDNEINLVDAVEAASSVPGILRVRLGSLEPMFFTDNLVKRLSVCPKFCHQFHLALQSGSDSVLSRMNRHYDTAEFLRVRNLILSYMPDSSFTTDIMVGFPGETEEEHKESMAFADKIGFSRMHVFPYSRRPGTVADKMKNQISASVKKRRAAEMYETAEKDKNRFLTNLIGTKQTIILEDKTSDGYFKGYADNYCETVLKEPAEKFRQGETVTVLITDVENDLCYGKIIQTGK